MGVHVGLPNETIRFNTLYNYEDETSFKLIAASRGMNSLTHEFYSLDQMECVKVSAVLGSTHQCIIKILLSECEVETFRRLQYYSRLNESYDGFGARKTLNVTFH